MPHLDNSVMAEGQPAPTGQLPAAVLWDMDGTLIDTEPQWLNAEISLSRQYGGSWDEELAKDLIGKPLTDSAPWLRERAGIPLDDDALIDALITTVVAQVSQGHAEWQPGAVELLATLRAVEVPCALVTMSYSPLARVVVDMLPAGSFTEIVTGDQVARGKPDPESYLTAAERLGVSIADCVAIEDSIPGVGAAVASGARVIGVPAHVPLSGYPGITVLETLVDVAATDLMTLTRPDRS